VSACIDKRDVSKQQRASFGQQQLAGLEGALSLCSRLFLLKQVARASGVLMSGGGVGGAGAMPLGST
jgi:hypothetical protein